MALKLFLLAALLSLSVAVPLQGQYRESSQKEVCPVSERQKLAYKPGHSYIYYYTVKSLVKTPESDPKAKAEVKLESEVVLSWITPCKVAVSIRSPKIDQRQEPAVEQILSEKPLIAYVKDGVVVEVLADPKDSPAGLNAKKGVLSQLQNVLPELSLVVKEKYFVESDTIGRCPTVYTVEETSADHLIRKVKNHRECKHYQNEASQNLFTSMLLKSPVSVLRESGSECKQVIRKSDKVMTSVSCKDRNVIHPVVISTHVAEQVSELTLKRVESTSQIPQLSEERVTDLKLEPVPQPKRESEVPKVRQLLKELCSKIEGQLPSESAKYMAEIIALLSRVPEPKIKELLREIRKGAICSKHQRLESLFLDAIAFVDNAGAVEVMVEEIVTERISGLRTPMYSFGMYLMKQPCIHSIEALKPLFESSKTPSSILLAAGNLVRRYTSQHPHALEEAPVREIYQQLARRIDSKCTQSESDIEKKQEVLVLLKTVGNLANATEPLTESALKCLESPQADVYVRIASAEAYRKFPCRKQPTKQLVEIALKKQEQTEVRIASYVAAIRCASYEQSELIVSKISSEPNTQVRSYILSHLKNLQSTHAPQLAGLKYNLTSIHIPSDYKTDIRKYSRNVDLSYYLKSLGVGAGVNFDVIYDQGSYLPRQLRTNITANVFDQIVNIAEVSVRSKDIEQVIECLFGPEGPFSDVDISQLLSEIKNLLNNEPSKVREYFQKYLSPRSRQQQMRSFQNMMTAYQSQRGSRCVDIDVAGRIFGQEIAFRTISEKFIQNPHFVEKAIEYVQEVILQTSILDKNSARTLQLNWNNFVPTVQGIPIQVKFVATALLSADLQTRWNSGELKTELKPSLSLDINAFVGYAYGVKAGRRSRTEISFNPQLKVIAAARNEKVEFVYDIPASLKLIKVQMKNHLIVKIPTKEDQIVSANFKPTTSRKMCSGFIQTHLGVQVCAEVEYPSVRESFPLFLGEYKFEIEAKKSNPSRPVLSIVGEAQWKETLKAVLLQVETPGARNPRLGEVGIDYKTSEEQRSLKVFRKSPSGQVRAVQIELMARRTPYGIFTEMKLYEGRQVELSTSDEVFLTRFKGESSQRQTEVDFQCRTQSHLARYLKADIATNVIVQWSRYYKYLPTEIEMPKFEFNVEIPRVIKFVNYMRKSQSSSSAYQVDSLVLVSIPSEELLKIEGKSQSRGQLLSNNYESEQVLKGKFLRNEMELKQKIVNNPKLKQYYYAIKSLRSQNYIVLVNLEVQRQSSSRYVTVAELKAPLVIRSYQLKGEADQTSPSSYAIKVTAQRESRPILHIQGPVNVQYSSAELRLTSDVKMSSPSFSQERQVQLKTVISEQKKEASILIKKGSQITLSLEGEWERESESSVAALVGVNIPRLVDAKVKTQRTPSLWQLIVTGYLMPNTQESRKVKGLTSIDFSQKEVKFNVAYDLSRDPQKKLESTILYNVNYERRYVSLKGEANVHGQSYRYNTEAILGFLSAQPKRKTQVSLKLTNQQGKQLKYEVRYEIDEETRPKKIAYQVIYKPMYREQNEIEGQMTYVVRQIPYEWQVQGEAKVNVPSMSIRQVQLKHDAKVDVLNREQKLVYKIEATSPQLRTPAKLHLELENTESKLEVLVDVNSRYPEMVITGKAAVTKGSYRYIQELRANAEIKVLESQQLKIKAIKNSQEIEFAVRLGEKKVFGIEQSQSENGVWHAKVTTPNSETEGRLQKTPKSYSLEFYPNKRQGNQKYEFQGKYDNSGANIYVQYPGSNKRYGVSTSISYGEKTSQGVIELDIFRSPQEKVEVSVIVQKKAQYSYKLKADAKIPGRSCQPQIEGDFAWSPEVKSLELHAKKSPSSKPVFSLVGKINRATLNNYVVYAKLKTPSDNVELVSKVHDQLLRNCRGASMNGTVHSQRLPSIDFAVSFCGPAYVEVGFKKSQQKEMYLTQVGIRGYESVKLGVDLIQPSTRYCVLSSRCQLSLYGRPEYQPKKPVAVLGAQMRNAPFVTVEAKFDEAKFQQYMRQVREIFNEISESQVLRELREEFGRCLPELSPELKRELESAVRVIEEVYEKVEREVRQQVDRVEEYVEEYMEKAQDIVQEYQRIYRVVIDYLRQTELFKMLETYKCQHSDLRCVVEIVERQVERLRQSVIVREVVQYVKHSSFYKWLVEQIEKFEEEFKEVFYKLVNKIKEIIHDIFDWAKHLIPDVPQALIRIIQEIPEYLYDIWTHVPLPYYYYPSPDSIRTYTQILPKHIRDPSYIFQYVIRPHSARATIQNEKLTTFDGLVYEMVPSRCEVIVAEVYGDRIMFSKPDQKESKVRVQLQSGRQITIKLDEDKRPYSPQLKKREALRVPGANLTQESGEIVVEMKGMRLEVQENTVEIWAKPMTYSKMEGMMGNHDAEMSNDVHSKAQVKYAPYSYGPKHFVSRPSTRKVMEEYRVNRSCRIPQA